MKRISTIITVFLLVLIPNVVKANDFGIDKYYMDMTVLNNGDLHIKEIFTMTGKYNGFERIINYENQFAPSLTGTTEDLKGSKLYNGSSLELISIQGITYNGTLKAEDINKTGDVFKLTNKESNGKYGVYEERATDYGKSLKIFNPSKNNKAYYIEYIVKNIGIVHDDIAEVGFNFIGNQLRESVEEFELTIHLPGPSTDLRVWAHGPLHGRSEIIDSETLKIFINSLGAETAVDTRFTFDKDLLINSKKNSNMTALDAIVELETYLADEANRNREKAKVELRKLAYEQVLLAEQELTSKYYQEALKTVKLLDKREQGPFLERLEVVERKMDKIRIITTTLSTILLIALIIAFIRTYQKYDKEYTTEFNIDYYRELPKPYGPEIVEYLLTKQITDKSLSNSILNLIADKVIEVEELEKKDHLLTLNEQHRKLTEGEEALVNWLFNDIGAESKVRMKEISKQSKSNYNKFLGGYYKWKTIVRREADSQNFYEENHKAATKITLFATIILIIASLILKFESIVLLPVLALILSIALIIYAWSITKRTKEGAEDYKKWMAFKKFLNDFGNFKEKELPQIKLWEKYLVYASVFGIAKKLQKQMEIKIKEFEKAGTLTGTNSYYNYHMFVSLNRLNRTISRSVSGAVNTANSEKMASQASSISSSGGGGGGGFSGGGGSFGGGGGGGRF